MSAEIIARSTCIFITVNTLMLRRNGQHFAADIFKHIFFHENVLISIKISLNFVPRYPVYNIPALVQIMAWRRHGDKPLSEPIMDSLPKHICVTQSQWVKSICLFWQTCVWKHLQREICFIRKHLYYQTCRHILHSVVPCVVALPCYITWNSHLSSRPT